MFWAHKWALQKSWRVGSLITAKHMQIIEYMDFNTSWINDVCHPDINIDNQWLKRGKTVHRPKPWKISPPRVIPSLISLNILKVHYTVIWETFLQNVSLLNFLVYLCGRSNCFHFINTDTGIHKYWRSQTTTKSPVGIFTYIFLHFSLAPNIISQNCYLPSNFK